MASTEDMWAAFYRTVEQKSEFQTEVPLFNDTSYNPYYASLQGSNPTEELVFSNINSYLQLSEKTAGPYENWFMKDNPINPFRYDAWGDKVYVPGTVPDVIGNTQKSVDDVIENVTTRTGEATGTFLGSAFSAGVTSVMAWVLPMVIVYFGYKEGKKRKWI